MPVFDFVCVQCQKKFTELVWGAEKISCPRCGAKNPRQLFSGLHIISDATRLETNAADLPTMAQWEKARRTAPVDAAKRGGRRGRPQDKAKRLSLKDLKPRPAVQRKTH